MTAIGNEFKTGQRAPASGVYAYVRHTDNLTCWVTPAQKEIPLSQGETFPPIRGCGHAAFWRLVRLA